MKRFSFVIILTVLAGAFQTANAGWTRTYGGESWDWGYCICQTTDGGYIVAGRTESFGNGSSDAWLLKLDTQGDTLWTRTYGEESWDVAYWVHQTSEGNYIVVGVTGSFGSGSWDVWLLKTTPDGDTVWTRTYGGEGSDEGVYVKQTDDGGYVIIGGKQILDSEGSYIWFIKTDSNGDTLFTHSYGGNKYDQCICAQQTYDKGYIILGYLWEEGHCLIKLYPDGTLNWIERCYMWEPEYVQQTHDDGYLVTGCAYPPSGEPPDLWLFKTDYRGRYEWDLSYGEKDWDYGHCIERSGDSHYIVTGFRDFPGNSEGDLWLLKINEWGDTLWTRTYGGYSADLGGRVQETEDSGYIVLGTTRSFGSGDYDLWLIKTDANGDTLALIEEPPVTHQPGWQVTPIGSQIVFRYSDRPDGFHTSIFDATGRKVDELNSSNASGTITWGKCHGPGVYFIRDMVEKGATKKAVLVR